jgi:hypothetical protein
MNAANNLNQVSAMGKNEAQEDGLGKILDKPEVSKIDEYGKAESKGESQIEANDTVDVGNQQLLEQHDQKAQSQESASTQLNENVAQTQEGQKIEGAQVKAENIKTESVEQTETAQSNQELTSQNKVEQVEVKQETQENVQANETEQKDDADHRQKDFRKDTSLAELNEELLNASGGDSIDIAAVVSDQPKDKFFSMTSENKSDNAIVTKIGSAVKNVIKRLKP